MSRPSSRRSATCARFSPVRRPDHPMAAIRLPPRKSAAVCKPEGRGEQSSCCSKRSGCSGLCLPSNWLGCGSGQPKPSGWPGGWAYVEVPVMPVAVPDWGASSDSWTAIGQLVPTVIGAFSWRWRSMGTPRVRLWSWASGPMVGPDRDTLGSRPSHRRPTNVTTLLSRCSGQPLPAVLPGRRAKYLRTSWPCAPTSQSCVPAVAIQRASPNRRSHG